MAAYVLLIGTCLAVITAAIAWGLAAGEFWREGAILLSLPWGVISIVDVYTGGALFSGWIAMRERSVPRTAAWVVAIVVLGNFATALYALAAWWTCGGDRTRFWLGPHAARSE